MGDFKKNIGNIRLGLGLLPIIAFGIILLYAWSVFSGLTGLILYLGGAFITSLFIGWLSIMISGSHNMLICFIYLSIHVVCVMCSIWIGDGIYHSLYSSHDIGWWELLSKIDKISLENLLAEQEIIIILIETALGFCVTGAIIIYVRKKEDNIRGEQ